MNTEQLLNEIASIWIGNIILSVSAVYALIMLITASKGKTVEKSDFDLFRSTLFAGIVVFVLNYLTDYPDGDPERTTLALRTLRTRINMITVYGLLLTVFSLLMMAIIRMRKKTVDYKPMQSCMRNGMMITFVSLALKLLFGGHL